MYVHHNHHHHQFIVLPCDIYDVFFLEKKITQDD